MTNSRKLKGGRPTKSDTIRRKYSLQLRVSAEELLHLNNGIRLTGLPRCEYIRSLIVNTTVKPRLTRDIQTLIRQLCGMANNLNQIARKANSTRSEYLYLAQKVDNLLNELEQ